MSYIQIIDGEDFDVYIFNNSNGTEFAKGKNSERARIVNLKLLQSGITQGIFALDPFQNKLYNFEGCYDSDMDFTPYDADDFIWNSGEKAVVNEDIQYGDIFSKGIYGFRTWYVYAGVDKGSYELKSPFGNFYQITSDVTKDIQDPIAFYKDTGFDLFIQFEFFGRVFYYYTRNGLISQWKFLKGYFKNIDGELYLADQENPTFEIKISNVSGELPSHIFYRERRVRIGKYSDGSYELSEIDLESL